MKKDQNEDEGEEERDDTKFDIKNIKGEPSKDVAALIELLEGNEEFELELEEILSAMQEDSLDLSRVQSHILLLIEATIKKIAIKKDDLELAHNLLKQNKALIYKHLRELSVYIMSRRSKLVSKIMDKIDTPEDKNLSLTTKMRNHLKKIMKRFAIYEVYKILTPRRIAGQTKRQNFVSNAVMRGMKVAMKNEGGSLKDIKSYGKGVFKDIKKYSKALHSKELRGKENSLTKAINTGIYKPIDPSA